MISKSTQRQLFRLLKAVSENECLIEDQRQTLASIPEFEPYAAFKRIARPGRTTLSCMDLICFLR
jgi:hypothetical protein